MNISPLPVLTCRIYHHSVLVRPTDEETTAIEKIVCFSEFARKGVILSASPSEVKASQNAETKLITNRLPNTRIRASAWSMAGDRTKAVGNEDSAATGLAATPDQGIP